MGKTNGAVGMWIIRSNHRKASAGPFFRSLLRRGGTGEWDMYEIYHYGMGNTDVLWPARPDRPQFDCRRRAFENSLRPLRRLVMV